MQISIFARTSAVVLSYVLLTAHGSQAVANPASGAIVAGARTLPPVAKYGSDWVQNQNARLATGHVIRSAPSYIADRYTAGTTFDHQRTPAYILNGQQFSADGKPFRRR